MKVIIEAPFTVNDEMENAIKNKLESLQKFEDKISQANVFFKVEEGASPHAVISEIRLRIPGSDVFASSTAEQDMAAFNSAAIQVKTQLIKRKEIIKAKR